MLNVRAQVGSQMPSMNGPPDLALANGFRQRRRALPELNAVLANLVPMGFVASPHGGGSYLMRRAP